MQTLKDVITEARVLLEEDTTVPPDVRAYLQATLGRAEFLLANLETYGAETLRSVAMELGGAMVQQGAAAEAAGDKGTASRWHSIAQLTMAGFAGGMGGHGANAVTAGVGKVA